MRDLTFFFAPASSLNDLYEFRARSLYSIDADSKIRLFAKRLMLEKFTSDASEAEQSARAMSDDILNETLNQFRQRLEPLLDGVMTHSGVVCFTEHRNNQRMWGTYGDQHAGACIEFSTDKASSRFASHLSPVLYAAHKPPICISDFMRADGRVDELFLTVLLCVKSVDWKEEQEWRLLLLASDEQSFESRIVPFERSAISRIFLGPRIREESAVAIESAAQSHDPPIPVFTREVDATEAKEELMGFEQIHSLEQLLYWTRRTHPDANTTSTPESGREQREARMIERALKELVKDKKDDAPP